MQNDNLVPQKSMGQKGLRVIRGTGYERGPSVPKELPFKRYEGSLLFVGSRNTHALITDSRKTAASYITVNEITIPLEHGCWGINHQEES